jgi:hypothetical protein
MQADWLFRLMGFVLAFLFLRIATWLAFDPSADIWERVGGIALGFAVVGIIYAEGAKRGRAEGFEQGKELISSFSRYSLTSIAY